MAHNLTIVHETGMRLSRVPVLRLKEKILGRGYKLSIVSVSDKKSKALNKIYRRKNKPTNILSFSIDKKEGELFINLSQIKRETKLFKREYANLTAFMLIHGMFHLKGLTHGSTMERQEKAMRKLFGI
jgi:probable rRNA maturation factor